MNVFRAASVLLLLSLACLVPATAQAQAAAEAVALPGGEVIQVLHPGVDGVSVPRVLNWTSRPLDYPAGAPRIARDTAVTVAVLVRRDGTVGATAVVHADHPNQGFERAALDAVEGWKFRPASRAGAAVDSYTFVKLRFPAPLFAADDTLFDSGLPGGVSSRSPGVGGGSRPAAHRGRPIGVYIPRAGYGTIHSRAAPGAAPGRSGR